MKTTLICGVHGVGKSSFIRTNEYFEFYPKYTCSELIKDYSGLEFKDKKISNVKGNQDILLEAVNHFVKEEHVLYDGHISLFNKERTLDTIECSVFEGLKIKHFILLKAPPSIILERILQRDGKTWLTVDLIRKAQENEEKKVIEYSHKMQATYEIFNWNEKTKSWNMIEKSINI